MYKISQQRHAQEPAGAALLVHWRVPLLSKSHCSVETGIYVLRAYTYMSVNYITIPQALYRQA